MVWQLWQKNIWSVHVSFIFSLLSDWDHVRGNTVDGETIAALDGIDLVDGAVNRLTGHDHLFVHALNLTYP